MSEATYDLTAKKNIYTKKLKKEIAHGKQ